MEMAKSGVMKKSAMDVSIVGKDAVQKLLSVSQTDYLHTQLTSLFVKTFPSL